MFNMLSFAVQLSGLQCHGFTEASVHKHFPDSDTTNIFETRDEKQRMAREKEGGLSLSLTTLDMTDQENRFVDLLNWGLLLYLARVLTEMLSV